MQTPPQTSTFSIEGVVAVQNHAISGSTLMQSLLDWHPNILSLPALHGHMLYVFWEQHAHLPARQLLNYFLAAHSIWFHPANFDDSLGLQQMGKNRDEPTKVDRGLFEQALLNLGWNVNTPLSRNRYIASLYLAYAQTLGRTLDQGRYWVVFPIHSHSTVRALYLMQDFPKTRFLHTTREPVQNMGSLIKHIFKNTSLDCGWVYLLEAAVRQVFMEDAVHIRWNDVHGIHPYVPDTADGRIESRCVRLEDMHKNSETTMREVAAWLGIAWNPALLQSTYDGKLWNNRVESIRQPGLGQATISQSHAEVFNRFDRWRLRHLGRPLFLFYRYAETKDFAPHWLRKWLMPLLMWLPFKVEWTFPHTNRAYSWIYSKIGASRHLPYIIQIMHLGWVEKCMKPLAAIISLQQALAGFVRTRHYMREILRQSFSTEPAGYVPLLTTSGL